MEKSVDKQLKDKNGMSDIEKWELYVAAVKQRDEARKKAEASERERRKNWREYYTFDAVIKELDNELGIVDITPSDEDNKKECEETKKECPDAPRKKRKDAI